MGRPPEPALRPILVLLCLFGAALRAVRPAQRENRWVSASWVARALAMNPDDDDAKASLVREFEKSHPREAFAGELVVAANEVVQP